MNVETLQFDHDVKAHIEIDEFPPNPRTDYDNAGTMVCWHRRYRLGDEHSYQGVGDWLSDLVGELTPQQARPIVDYLLQDDLGVRGDYRRYFKDDPDRDARMDNRVEWIRTYLRYGGGSDLHRVIISRLIGAGWVILPLYLYDHSGITMSTSAERFRACDSAGWDSGMVGFIYIGPEDIEKEGWDAEAAANYLAGEVETYDQYLTGDIYDYRIETPLDFNADSLGGIFGLDYARREARAAGEAMARQFADPNQKPAFGIGLECPMPGDFIRLDGEHHTEVGSDRIKTVDGDNSWFIVSDNRGEEFVITRNPDDDNDLRMGWKLAYPQAWSGMPG